MVRAYLGRSHNIWHFSLLNLTSSVRHSSRYIIIFLNPVTSFNHSYAHLRSTNVVLLLLYHFKYYTVFSHYLCTVVLFVEYLVAGMSYPDEAVRASVVYILVQLCVRKEDAVLALPLVHTMCRSLSVSLATSRSHELTINLMGEWISIPIQEYL